MHGRICSRVPIGYGHRMRIAVLDDYQGVAASLADWASLPGDVEFFGESPHAHAALVERLKPFDVIVAMRERTPFPRRLLESLENLELLVTTGMRNASIDVAAAQQLGINVSGTPSPGHATAELTFAMILALARGLVNESASVVSGGWQVGLGSDVRGTTLGLVGLGRLGSQLAGFGLSFGMEVIAWSENLSGESAEAHGVERVEKGELFSRSDFVSIHLRLSERTRHLVGARELAAMKRTAYLINTSRGPIVDEGALLEAVRSGSIAGAGVDTFSVEPLPTDHPFRSEPRILATPHIGYVTRQTYEIFYAGAIEAIAAWAAGTPIRVLEP